MAVIHCEDNLVQINCTQYISSFTIPVNYDELEQKANLLGKKDNIRDFNRKLRLLSEDKKLEEIIKAYYSNEVIKIINELQISFEEVD